MLSTKISKQIMTDYKTSDRTEPSGTKTANSYYKDPQGQFL